MIDGIKLKKLKFIPDERGRLMEILRCDDDLFIKFGQVYMTTTYPQVIKAWHYHKLQFDSFICIKGMVKLVCYDAREESKTKGEVNEFFVGEHNLSLIQIPPMVFHGWKCISETEAWVLNVVTEPYNYNNPDEFRLPYNSSEIPYDWQIKMG
ncbi:MAG TPA: dTDP-4-dehydrorhamnose 3,5-epimerase family protein [Bacteroidota bacterium]|jgi:dTDP-4-dehydrorhamnose 3,5-epimerase|nr:dTDP-4-dehydrorhamnose 3,5-epimerase family protein [Bacteroidota bacterium]